MKRYEFRLAQVLRVRRAEHEQTEIALAIANAKLRSLIERRDTEAARCLDIGSEQVSFDPAGFIAHRAAAGLAAGALAGIDASVNLAAADAALAQIAWSNAHQRVTALERLEERRRDEWLIEQGRIETRELDELATAAFPRELAVTEAVS